MSLLPHRRRRARPLAPPVPAPRAAWERLSAVVNEAIVLQDSTERLLVEISDEGPLAELAQRGGPVISRLEALRFELPPAADPELRRWTELVDPLLAHHALVLHSALALLSANWRSERMVEELHKIDGLGRPAQRLEQLKLELDARLGGA